MILKFFYSVWKSILFLLYIQVIVEALFSKSSSFVSLGCTDGRWPIWMLEKGEILLFMMWFVSSAWMRFIYRDSLSKWSKWWFMILLCDTEHLENPCPVAEVSIFHEILLFYLEWGKHFILQYTYCRNVKTLNKEQHWLLASNVLCTPSRFIFCHFIIILWHMSW